MTREEAIAIIHKEYLCVNRDCDIERSCGKCDLMMPSKEPILEAYSMAIKVLEQEPCKDVELVSVRQELLERGDEVVSFRQLVERFEEVEEYFKGIPWNLKQIYNNFNILTGEKPCTDAISRQVVLDEMYKRKADGDAITAGFIKNLPSVNPQEPKTIQEKQAESEKYQKAFDDGYANGYAQARFDYEGKP